MTTSVEHFERHALLVGGEAVDRQARDQPAAVEIPLDAADVGQPARLGEGADQHAAERIGGVAPEVLAAVGPGHVLAEAEADPAASRRRRRASASGRAAA